MTKQFIDCDKSGNLQDGVEYFAVGLVEEEFPNAPSGKELAVVFIDPWGKLQREWRSRKEVTLSDISEADAGTLRDAFVSLEKDWCSVQLQKLGR